MVTTDRIAEIDQIIARHDLGQHPFYQNWRNGTLPKAKLATYSSEYGEFVKTIGQGWATVGLPQYVQEETEHVGLWATFRDELGAPEGATNTQTKALVDVARNLFATRPEAVGALYAFEAQQPATATTKLDGLRAHYGVSEKAEEYFVVHARQHSEYQDLQVMLNAMSDDDFARAKTACAFLATAMWSGLDGVYYTD